VPGAQEAREGRGEKRHNSTRCCCFLREQSNRTELYTPGTGSAVCPQQKLLVGWFGSLVNGRKQYRLDTELRSGRAFEALKLGTRYHGVVTLLSLLSAGRCGDTYLELVVWVLLGSASGERGFTMHGGFPGLIP
jgi:hypothetical protein